jgi:hypothetical protein
MITRIRYKNKLSATSFSVRFYRVNRLSPRYDFDLYDVPAVFAAGFLVAYKAQIIVCHWRLLVALCA